ncbi:hypothetical protein Tco_1011472, partial [Tanacetum coccineum]
SKAGGFSYDRSVAATDINRRSTIADMEQRNVVMNTDSSIYYLGCIRSIGDVLPFGDANKDVQLAATLATHYYINPRTHAAFKEKYSLNPPLQITKYRYEDPEKEKNRNRQTLSTLLQQNPTSFKGLRFTCEAMITAVRENRVALRIMQPMQQGNGARRHLHLYNFNAAVTDGTASAQFTFFTNTGEQFTGHPCLQLAEKYKGTSAGKFTVDDILDIHPSIKSPNTETAPAIEATPRPTPGITKEVAKIDAELQREKRKNTKRPLFQRPSNDPKKHNGD